MKTDVKHNTVYYVSWHGEHYIVMYDATRIGNDYFIRVKDNTYGNSGSITSNSQFLYYLQQTDNKITIREANSFESRWMRKCIEEDTYVECPKEEVINHYEIY